MGNVNVICEGNAGAVENTTRAVSLAGRVMECCGLHIGRFSAKRGNHQHTLLIRSANSHVQLGKELLEKNSSFFTTSQLRLMFDVFIIITF
jgi:hypothetical protein